MVDGWLEDTSLVFTGLDATLDGWREGVDAWVIGGRLDVSSVPTKG